MLHRSKLACHLLFALMAPSLIGVIGPRNVQAKSLMPYAMSGADSFYNQKEETRASAYALVQSPLRAARAAFARGDLKSAGEQLRAAQEIAQSQNNQAALSLVFRDMAQLWRRQGQLLKAFDSSMLALANAQSAYGKQSVELLPFLQEATSDARMIGKAAQLPALLESLTAVQAKCGASENFARMSNLVELSRLYQQQSRFREAEAVHSQMLALSQTINGIKNDRTLMEFPALIQLRFNNKDYVGAEVASRLWISAIPKHHLAELGKANFYLGIACHNQEKFAEAKTAFENSWANSIEPMQRADAGLWLLQILTTERDFSAADKLSRELYEFAQDKKLQRVLAAVRLNQALLKKKLAQH